MIGIKDKIVEGFSNAVNYVHNLIDQARSWGSDLIQNIINGLHEKIQDLADGVTDVANTIRDFLHFSVPDRGPLTDFQTWMPDFMQGMAQGIERSRGLIQKAIVITLGLRGDVEKNRQHLYSIFPLKKECTVYYQNQNRNLKINGFIETIEADIFVQQEDVQISIICPNPYFEGISTIDSDIRKVQPLFEFPFSITEPIPFGNIMRVPTCSLNNIGDVDCGCIFHFRFYEYTNYLKITNEVTHEYMDLQHAGFSDGDELFINTNFGNLRIIHYSADGSEHNLLPFLKKGSSWIHLETGLNTITFSIAEGHYEGVGAKVEYTPLYGGV